MKNKKKSYKKKTSTIENNNSNQDQREIYKQLYITNISIWAIFLILYAILMNIEYLFWQRSKILDNINNTNFTENMEDLSESPRKSNLIYLITTAIFVGIIWDQYNTVKNNSNSEKIDIQKAYERLVAILLLLLATFINFDVLNNSKYK
jgi:hypothetical protein